MTFARIPYASPDALQNYRHPSALDHRLFERVLFKRDRGDRTEKLDAWCSEHCTDTWTRSRRADHYYFESLSDAIHFRLRWIGSQDEHHSTNGASS